jgi:hypothetical protein
MYAQHQPLTETWSVQDRLTAGLYPSADRDRQLSQVAAERFAVREALRQRGSQRRAPAVRRQRSVLRRAWSTVTGTA